MIMFAYLCVKKILFTVVILVPEGENGDVMSTDKWGLTWKPQSPLSLANRNGEWNLHAIPLPRIYGYIK